MTEKKVEWYHDFIDLKYKPKKTDLKVLFYFEPDRGITKQDAIGRVASESSTGTWTTLFKLPEMMKKLMATAYKIEGNYVYVAYPLDLWEKGNLPQLLSGIAGNIFGMKALKNLRLIDASLPEEYIKNYKGPNLGIEGLRKYFRVYDRPLTGAVPKPKVGFSSEEHAKIGYETWLGGFDLVKDDENLTSQSFNNFYKRVKLMTKLRDKAEKETGEVKDALLNITAETKEMEKRAKFLHDYGWKYAMIDVVVSGTSATQTLREKLRDYDMAIHAHRAMHASFDRNLKHGISMQFLAKIMRLIGVEQIHSGTGVGKLVGSISEVKSISSTLRDKIVKEKKGFLLEQNWKNIKSSFPVSSGGVHPGIVPDEINIYGKDFVLLVSGGIHGHPQGTRAGAKATMQAIEAVKKKISLEEYSKNHNELAQALEKWGRLNPK
ncbi:type III ribulose-bisphosphate carboxylase [Candidatus Pacearchaeota archaeon]|uniref:Ribulose bisphosphate carboxylase n=1 Tax=uncultured Candidatus Pacearchaeota archaeon TaxID=2109283 RepID=A0A447IUF6_9ARCH|nr:type III ribulose-bisphosphate carboxylase [Candidatus Pacearchaeota archaeon]VDS11154.1 RuBisCO long chain, Form III-b [uncultured Candidatus Pacearchaeota archaeon]VDS11174.1 RuBisCO long chain, Form III-b [uncultured Candidatus Pacearchaeota archaeon]